MPARTESNRKLHGEVQAETRLVFNEILGETEEGEAWRQGESEKVGGGGGKKLYSGVLSLYG